MSYQLFRLMARMDSVFACNESAWASNLIHKVDVSEQGK